MDSTTAAFELMRVVDEVRSVFSLAPLSIEPGIKVLVSAFVREGLIIGLKQIPLQ